MKPNIDFYDPVFLEKLRNIHIVANKLFHGRLRGKRRSLKKGVSLEFAEFRSYAPGDDFRFIDWNIMARLQRVMIRSFFDEENISVHILIDTSQSMHFGSSPRILLAKKIAACLASVALANHDSVGIGTFSDRPITMIPAHTGTNQIHKCFTILENMEPSGKTNIENVIKRILSTRCDKGIVILLSDMLDVHGYETPLIYALTKGFEVHLIHIDQNHDFISDDCFLRLHDSETEQELDITYTQELQQLLKEERIEYSAEIKRFCHARCIPYFNVESDTSFNSFMLRYFKTLLQTQ